MNHSRYRSLGFAVAALTLSAVHSPADPASRPTAADRFAAANIEKQPQFLSLHDLMALRKEHSGDFNLPPRVIDASDPALPEMAPMRLAAGPRRPAKTSKPKKKSRSKGKAKAKNAVAVSATVLAPSMPGGFAPMPATAPKPQTPRWVRYPLEFQLCGISLGTRAVNKDRYNRIDRYGLFAMHGNPTAVVVPIVTATTTGGTDNGAGGGGTPGAGGPGGAAGVQANAAAQQTNQAPTVTNFTKMQTPPLAATIFPSVENGELPNWAAAITVPLDNNHVEWLYNRGTYAMGFLVDRLGYVDGIVCAGVESPIARTQLEDPVHTVKLGDDLRKVLFRYGYPDSVDAYNINIVASTNQTPLSGGTGAAGGTGGGGAGAGAAPGGAAGGAGGGAGATAQAGNGAFQTFEVRYEQSYNIVFTIRYNRVVRMYIFGDPDFFNAERDKKLRQDY